MKLTVAVFAAFLSISAAFAQAPAAQPTQPFTAPSAPAAKAEPEKRSLTAEQASHMADIDATEAQLTLKLGELGQLLQKVVQSQRNEVWAAACTSAGWLKPGECQVDATSRSITRLPQDKK